MSWTKQDFDIIIKEFENDICPVCGKAFKLHKPMELKFCLRKSKTRTNFIGGSRGIDDGMKSFPGICKSCCVGVVDIVDSTKITATLGELQVKFFYITFLSSIASIIKECGGVVVKNIGDSMFYYFPKTSDILDRSAFAAPLECGMKMIEARSIVDTKMRDQDLPNVNYRVSSDLGMITFVTSINSHCEDIFGTTVNLCAKINKMAMPNTMVIGGDLYQVVKSFEEYQFEFLSGYHSGQKPYPVYSVTHSKTEASK